VEKIYFNGGFFKLLKEFNKFEEFILFGSNPA
jgi:hypothetical protein